MDGTETHPETQNQDQKAVNNHGRNGGVARGWPRQVLSGSELILRVRPGHGWPSRLGVDVEVTLTRPCIFCVENH
jgi:hypothetical protein